MIALPIAYAVMLGVMCLCIAFGVTALSNVLSNAMRNLPVVGSQIAETLDGAMFSIVRSAIQWLLSQCWDAVQFVAAPFVNLWHLMDGVITYMWGATFAITQVKHTARNGAARVTARVSQVESTLDHALNGVVAWTQGGFDTIYHDFEGDISGVVNWTQGGFDTIYHDFEGDISGVVNWTQGGFDTIYRDLEGDISGVVSWVQTSVDTIYRSIDGAITRTDQYVGEVYDTLRTSIEQSQRAAEGYAQAAVTASEGVILGYLGSQVLPAIDALTTTVDDCAVPYCAEKNTLGRTAKTLLTLVEDGLVLAFLAYVITEPTEAAKVTAGPITDIVGEGVAIIEDLVSAL